jgi:signal peptidase
VDGHTVVVRRLPVSLRPDRLSEVPHAPQKPRSAPMRVLHRAARVGLNLVFVAVIASVGIMLGPAAFGFHRYVILTGSMTGTYDRGSVVFDRPSPTSGLKVGDPITYTPPPGFTSQKLVTHRIWWIGRGTYGQRIFRTKGDANKHPDVWKFTLNQPTQDRVVFHIPEVGYVFILLSLRDFRVVLIGVPALIIGLVLLRGLWRDGGEEERRKKLAEQGWREESDPGGAAVLPPRDPPATHCLPVQLDLRLPAYRAPAPLATAARARRELSCWQGGKPLRIGRLRVETALGAGDHTSQPLSAPAQGKPDARTPIPHVHVRSLARRGRPAERIRSRPAPQPPGS